LAYDGAEGDFCAELAFSPTVKFQNLGDTEITNASLGLYVNGDLVETQAYEGSLPTFSIVDIPFGEVTVSESSDLSIVIETVNGSADDVDDYNEVNASLNVTTEVAETSTINVNVVTDNYGPEVYWVVRDLDGIVYLEGGPAAVGASGGGQGVLGPIAPGDPITFEETVELPVDGCYEFAIYDDYGDGICCQYGEGFFNVTDANGNVLAEGATFTNSVEKSYSAQFTSSVPAIEGLTALTVSPNPTAGLSNVTFGLVEATDIDVVVYNVMGQAVKTFNQSFNSGVNQFQLDASNFANGVYFVNLNSAEGTSTVKFTVNK